MMKDIPFFTTENGAASLVLREIPYTARAYITLRSSMEPEILLEECVAFCRMCGAEEVYASGDECLGQYPLYAQIVEMRCRTADLPEVDAALFPVQEHTVAQWRDIYNEKMKKVPNAAFMDAAEMKRMLISGDGYFVHRNGMLLGIGRASAGRIDALAAAQKGAGEAVLCALAHGLCGETVTMEVAAENVPAMKLYSRLGFIATREISRWYKVL